MFTKTLFSLLVGICSNVGAQDALQQSSGNSKKYMFYLHGAIVQEMGINAVSEEFGKYEYNNILDSLRRHGFIILSEVRPKGTIVEKYATKVSRQVDSLLRKGIQPENVVIVGASQGAYIAIEVANTLKNARIKFAILALCNEYNVNYYSMYRKELCGNFLSIYEESDQKKSCMNLLSEPFCKTGFNEIRLTMGNGHGFIFKPYSEWIQPLVKWIQTN